MRIKNYHKKIVTKIFSILVMLALVFGSVPAPVAYATLYSPGETLNPACTPTDVNCGVITSALKGRLSEALTGTVGITPGASLVTGSSTAFTTELSAGDAIKIGSNVFTVSSISSNTSLTLSSAVPTSTATTTGATAYRDPTTLFSVAKGDSTNVLTVSKAGLLALINALTISSSTPATTANTLYNQNGTLYWNALALGTAKTSTVHHSVATTLALVDAHNRAEIHAENTGGFTIDASAITTDTWGATIINTSGSSVTLTPSGFAGAFLRDGSSDIGFTSLAIAADEAYSLTVTDNAGAKFLNVVKLGGGTVNAFAQNGNAFGALATLGTTDNNALRFIASSTEVLRILANGNVGIGTVVPSGKLSVTPTQYNTGTASQSLTTVTGVGTTFTSAMVGSQFVFANGTSAGTITAFSSTTSLTVSTSQTVTSQAYNIAYTGLQVNNLGNVGIGTATPNQQLEITGNFRLPTSTATAGIVYSGANRFIHNYGTNNFFAGANAGNLTMTGTGTNTVVGSSAFSNNTTGSSNSAFGYNTLNLNTTGASNTAVGNSALAGNIAASNNTAVGSGALMINTLDTGNDNTAVGVGALALSAGSKNTAIGYNAGMNNTSGISGSNNSFFGYKAGDNVTTGSNNLVVGYDIDAPSATASNQLSIGNLIFGTGLDATGTAIATGNIGIGTATPGAKLHIAPSTAAALRIDAYGASAGNTSEIRFQELTANGINYTGFKSPDSLAANVLYTLPNADGTSGQVLSSNGAGALSWLSTLTSINGFAQNGSSFGGLATLGTNDNNGLAFETNSVERLRIDASGNVGIGTNTPTAKLEISPSGTAGVTWATKTAPTISYKSVAFGNGTYVAVADTNLVATSPDSITWTQQSIPTASIWRDVTYANGLFVAVGSVSGVGTVMTSPNGITWTDRTPSANNNWQSIAYGNNIFVAVASSGTGNRVMTSPDGITWTSRTSASDDLWYGVTYGNNLFVAVSFLGSTFLVMTSPDGITWTGRTASNSPWNSVAYGGGLFVAVSEGAGVSVMTSPDGITWTDRTAAATNFWRGVTYGNGIFVAVASSGTGNRVMTSPDGITWTSRTTPEDNNWNGITFGNNLFVAVADSGTNRIMTSSGALPTAILANGGISVAGSVVPTSNIAYDLGSATNRFRSLYLSGTTLYIGDQSLSNSSGSLTWSGTSIQATPNATSATDIKLSELSGNGSNYTGFKAPDALAANVLYTLPNADGATGQSLTTNGSGGLSWASSAGVSVGKTSTVHHSVGTALAITTAHNNAEIHAESTGGFTIDGASFTEDTFGATIVNTGGVSVTLTPSNFVGAFLRDGTADAGFTTLSIEPDTAYKLTVTNNGGSKFLNVIKFAAGGGSSQWTTSGSNIYYNTGNVAIGTTTPSSSAKLLISGAVAAATAGSSENAGLVSTGGTILGTAVGGTDTVIQYNSSGSFTPPTGVASVQVLVVAGGGGGGVSIGGGGGAGGYRYVASQAVVAGTSYPITVGAGGAGAPNWSTKGSNGTGSSFTTITTVGGGAGSGQSVSGGGVLGGSGGGGARNNNAGGAGTSGEGNSGGSGSDAGGAYGGGGGGGAGAVGGNGSGTTGGNGGVGLSSSITGVATFYAGGGGGGRNTGTLGLGGNGGGGNAADTAAGVNGTANTGGGGGANSSGAAAGGAGGSGVVIVRFATVPAVAGGVASDNALLRVIDTGSVAGATLAFFESTSGNGCIISGQTTSLACSSDISLKKNINALENSLGNVLALNPVTFDWNSEADGAGSHVGFIAQDVEKIFPGLVVVDPNGKKALSYDKFAPIIVAALQEQYGGMMGVNIASVAKIDPTLAELFASTTTLATLDDDGYQYTSVITNPIGYISERVDGGIKVVRTLVAEKMIAVEASFKRIFANELCLTDASGQLVCVTGENLKQIGGQTRALMPAETASVSEQIAPATAEATVAPIETAPIDTNTDLSAVALAEEESSSEPMAASAESSGEPMATANESTVLVEEVVPEETSITTDEPVAEYLEVEPPLEVQPQEVIVE